MSELREYEVDLGNHTTTMLLDEENAARYGEMAKPVEAKQAAAPANKARTAAPNK